MHINKQMAACFESFLAESVLPYQALHKEIHKNQMLKHNDLYLNATFLPGIKKTA